MRFLWETRINDVIECGDNAFIPRVPDAGLVMHRTQIMHNGIKVESGGYYGRQIERLLLLNAGVHEPQEERVFGELIQRMPPGAVMLELGAYWCFYSIWFRRVVPQSRIFMVERNPVNLEVGKRNLELNEMDGLLINGAVGAIPGRTKKGVEVVTVDQLVQRFQLERLHCLHADIEGFEMEMLQGAAECFRRKLVDVVFISTHSNSLHAECSAFLRDAGFRILASANRDETFSFDGVLIACREELAEKYPAIDIDLKKRSRSFLSRARRLAARWMRRGKAVRAMRRRRTAAA